MENTLDELKRLIDLLPETDPRTDKYLTLLRSIEVLGNDGIREVLDAVLADCQAKTDSPNPIRDDDPCRTETASPHEVPKPEPEPPEDPDLPEAPEPIALTDELIAAMTEHFGTTTPTKVQMRGYLANSKTDFGVNVGSCIKALGYNNLTAVPVELYGNLFAAIEEAKG